MSAVGWDGLEGRAPRTVEVDGVRIARGSLVRLRPRARGGDVFDAALAGRVALVESIQQDLEGGVQLTVVLEDDPGRELADTAAGPAFDGHVAASGTRWGGAGRAPGHRFFFAPDEVEPVGDGVPEPHPPSVLVAGIGNVLLADDGFGVEVARLLAQRELPRGVKVADFGIRGLDLAYELQEDYDVALLLDAVPRGAAPGTLYVIEHDPADEAGSTGHVAGSATPGGVLDPHGMDPLRVLALARALGRVPPRVLVVGCEPQLVPGGDDDELAMGLSAPVRAAAAEAVELVERLIREEVRA